MSNMRKALSALAISALFALSASGQTASSPNTERTFHLIGGESPQAMQEIAYAVGSVTELPKLPADAEKATITVAGTPEQIALAAWMIAELDQPTKAANLTYIPPGGADNVTRIFYLAHVAAPQQIQELINTIRSMTELRPMAAYNSANVIVLRGAQAQVEQAEWIVKSLDLAPDQALPPVASTQVPFPPGSLMSQNPAARAYFTRLNQARIFYLKNNETRLQTQEIINVLRSTTELQRVTAFTTLRAICVLGSASQAEAAAWLVSELEKPTPQAAVEDSYYMTPEFGADGEVRVFFVPSLQTPQATQQLVNLIRMAKLQRITAYNSAKGIVIRGTPGQVAAAEEVVQQYAKK